MYWKLGLTPKHVDVPELLRVLDTHPGRVALLAPELEAPGVELFAPPVPDFSLARVVREDATAPETSVPLVGPAIAVATRGRPILHGGGGSLALTPGSACLITPDEGSVRVGGTGDVFFAQPGR